MRLFSGVLFGLLLPTMLFAADFYILFDKCKLTASYFVHSDESLKVFEGDGSLTSCTRTSQTITCKIDFFDRAASKASEVYKIRIESAQLLIFTNEAMGDYYVVNTMQNVATLITRVLEPAFAGTKVCNGLYLTASEWKAYQKNKR
jgi:hypothetical protein